MQQPFGRPRHLDIAHRSGSWWLACRTYLTTLHLPRIPRATVTGHVPAASRLAREFARRGWRSSRSSSTAQQSTSVTIPRARDGLAAGAFSIGKPSSWARISFRTGYDIYAGQPYLAEQQRFVLIDVGVHVLDVARALLGEVTHSTAELQRRNPNAAGEDTATMLLRHESGAVSVVECTYGSRRVPDSFPETLLEVEGERGAPHGSH